MTLLLPAVYSSQKGPIPPITSGYGSDSTLIVRVDSIPSHCWARRKIYYYYPQDIKNPVPAVFFLKGMGVPDKNVYEHLLKHIASRGFFVIMGNCF